MYPLVLIKSFGQEKCSDIIKNIFIVNGSKQDPPSTFFDNCNIKTHKLCIKTKYYTTDVLLLECEADINSIPIEVKSKIEASLFYFDSNDKYFLNEIDTLIKFVEDNNVELASLLTRNLGEQKLNGLTYDEVKGICKMHLDIVDLNDQKELEEYADVLDLLRNHLWSSVSISDMKSHTICDYVDISDANDCVVEETLNDFEELISSIQKFKNTSQSLSREEVLNNAEKLAELFANILNED